jgi:hypothetical protein
LFGRNVRKSGPLPARTRAVPAIAATSVKVTTTATGTPPNAGSRLLIIVRSSHCRLPGVRSNGKEEAAKTFQPIGIAARTHEMWIKPERGIEPGSH